jgi:hypothetical protein
MSDRSDRGVARPPVQTAGAAADASGWSVQPIGMRMVEPSGSRQIQ